MPTNLNEAIQSAADSLAADPAAAERLIRPALAQAPADPRAADFRLLLPAPGPGG